MCMSLTRPLCIPSHETDPRDTNVGASLLGLISCVFSRKHRQKISVRDQGPLEEEQTHSWVGALEDQMTANENVKIKQHHATHSFDQLDCVCIRKVIYWKRRLRRCQSRLFHIMIFRSDTPCNDLARYN